MKVFSIDRTNIKRDIKNKYREFINNHVINSNEKVILYLSINNLYYLTDLMKKSTLEYNKDIMFDNFCLSHTRLNRLYYLNMELRPAFISDSQGVIEIKKNEDICWPINKV